MMIKNFSVFISLIVVFIGFVSTPIVVIAQETETFTKAQFNNIVTRFWFNTYGNIQLTDNLIYVAQTHFRFQETEDVPVFGQFSQFYSRQALTYVFSKKFSSSVGGVFRANRNIKPLSATQSTFAPEWRLWHEYQFVIPYERLMIYHRLRIEHRWAKGFEPSSVFSFRNRYRYMLNAKIPINNTRLISKTFYASPEIELIMQSGESVINSPMEDLRLNAAVGYIVNPRLIYAVGLMYSVGQTLNNGAIYNQRFTLRFHVYFNLDFRRKKGKFPPFQLINSLRE